MPRHRSCHHYRCHEGTLPARARSRSPCELTPRPKSCKLTLYIRHRCDRSRRAPLAPVSGQALHTADRTLLAYASLAGSSERTLAPTRQMCGPVHVAPVEPHSRGSVQSVWVSIAAGARVYACSAARVPVHCASWPNPPRNSCPGHCAVIPGGCCACVRAFLNLRVLLN